MGRRPRIIFPGAVYHVMARGVDGMNVFIDDSERHLFLTTLKRVCADASARVFAYCLMGNHFHIAIQAATIPLSTIMQRLLTRYAAIFNRRHHRVGHLFQSRHKAVVCVNEAYLQRLIHYIHQNPVRAGFVKEAREWRWSSVRDYPEDGSQDNFTGFDPWRVEAPGHRVLLRAIAAPSSEMDSLAVSVSARTGVPICALRSRSKFRWVVSAKRTLALEALRNGHSVRSIADWMNSTCSTISNYLITC